jgi:hypothetical protein
MGPLQQLAENALAVTPHASNPAKGAGSADAGPVALYVGTGGNLTVKVRWSATDVVLKNVPSGTILPVAVTHVRATGTTATDIVALW